jgi:hypothetical protein
MRGKWESPSINGFVCSAIRVKDTPPTNLLLSRDRLILPCSVSAEGSLPRKDSSVFVDPGCSELALMDARFVTANTIPTSRLPSPIPVFLADDSPLSAAWITEVTHPLTLTIADHHVEELTCKVIRLTHPLMVGLPWLRRHNPAIRWTDSSVVFDSDLCISCCCVKAPFLCQLRLCFCHLFAPAFAIALAIAMFATFASLATFATTFGTAPFRPVI